MAVEPPNRKYYQWLALQRQWRKQFSTSKDMEATFEEVLSPDVLFQPGSDMSSIPFYIGTSLVDNFSYIIVPFDFMPAIRHCLHMLMVSRCKEKSSPTPSNPRSGGQRYRNVRQISFKNRAAYFGTISNLRAINSRARWLVQQISNCQIMRVRLTNQKVVVLSMAIQMSSDSKSISHIAWTMFDARQQRVLDQNYITSPNTVNTSGVIDPSTPMNISVEQALQVLDQDITWALNRDNKVVLLAYDISKCILILKHQGCTQRWTTPTENIHMFSLKDMYEVMTHKLGQRATLHEIVNHFQLPPWHFDNGSEAKYVLRATLELCKRPVPAVEEFGDLYPLKAMSPEADRTEKIR